MSGEVRDNNIVVWKDAKQPKNGMTNWQNATFGSSGKMEIGSFLKNAQAKNHIVNMVQIAKLQQQNSEVAQIDLWRNVMSGYARLKQHVREGSVLL